MTIRRKISLLVALFMLLFSIVLFTILYVNIRSDVKNNVIQNFSLQQKTITQSQRLIYDRLVESALLVSENPAFKANVSLEDRPSVLQIIEEFLDFLKVDLIYVTDSKGSMLAAYPLSTLSEVTFMEKGINKALIGEIPEIEFDSPVIWYLDQELYQVVSVPIMTNYDILGSLSLGTAITHFEASALQLSSNMDVHFLHDSHIHASSSDLSVVQEIENLVVDNLKELDDTADNFLESDEYFVTYGAIDENEMTFLISSTSKSKALELLQKILDGMILLAIGSLIAILLMSNAVGRIISAPVLKVINAFRTIEKGDLTVRLKENDKDEFGKLGYAFNNMVTGLKERLELQSYVGGHTLEKVAGVVESSKKINAVILFSDIRGFTNYSQNRSPDQVIAMLNEWLGFQAKIILQYGGSIDKFVGDEVMAIFSGQDAILRSISCAKEIQQHSMLHEGYDLLGLGIGINYGNMIMGDIGIDQRKDHTVIGNVVNIASRLCSKASKGQILIPTHILPSDTSPSYDRTEIQLKGIDQPIEIAIINGLT